MAPRGRPLEHAPAIADGLRRRPRAPAARSLRERPGASQPRLRAGIRLRPRRGPLGVRRPRLPRGGRTRRRRRHRAPSHDGHAPRLRRLACHRPNADEGRRHAVRRALVVGSPADRHAATTRRTSRLVWTAHHWQHWLDRAEFPDHPWRTFLQRSALTLKGLSYAPDGRPRGGRDDLAARDARRGAQLGLPLHVDPRRDLRAVGPLHARLRLGGERLLPLPRRHRRGRAGEAADHVRGRRRGGAARDDPRPSLRLRGRAAGAGRKRRPQAGPARRLGRDPRLLLPAHEVARPASRAHLADPREAGRVGARPLAGAGSRSLGDPRRAEALHLLEADVLGRGRPRCSPRRDPRRPRVRGTLAVGSRGDQGRHLRERDRRARRVHASTTRRRRWTPRFC